MARFRSRSRRGPARAIARRKLNWVNGITTTTESNVAPNGQTNVTLINNTNLPADQMKLVVERIVGEIWTGFIGTPEFTAGNETQVFIVMLLYTRPQDPAGLNPATLNPLSGNYRFSHRILWSRYDYIHMVGFGAGNSPAFGITGIQMGQQPHVDIRVKRIIDTSDTDLVLSVAVPASSDLSCYFVDNLRVLTKQP